MSNQDGGLVGPRLETRGGRWLGIYSNQPATGLPYHMGLEKSRRARRREEEEGEARGGGGRSDWHSDGVPKSF